VWGTGRDAVALAFDQADVARTWAFLRVFWGEFDTLAFAKQLEHRAPDGAAMEEVLDSAFVADEPEALVDEESCDCPGWHSRSPPVRNPQRISPREISRLRAPANDDEPSGREAG